VGSRRWGQRSRAVNEPAVTIILIEDDKQIRRFVRATLEAQGLDVHEASTASQGLTEAATRKPDLMIADLGLPDRDGLDVIRDIRTWSTVPILVLSARTRETDKVAAFDAGADDYLTKPFGTLELLARIQALLRRRNRRVQDETSTVNFGSVSVDLAARRVTHHGEAIHLTPIEYRVLSVMVRHAGQVMTQQHILNEVWGPTHLSDGHYLRIYMANLRKKLEQDPAQPEHLITETGVGYRLIGVR
jgi:two-component system KDP operon response regulator KdpE